MTYQEQIKHPKWQKKRLEILERDEYMCQFCGNDEKTLNVHHLIYHKNKMIWEYDNKYLITYCNECHDEWHKTMNKIKEYLVMGLYDLKEYEDLLMNLNQSDSTKVLVYTDIIKLINAVL